MRVGSMTKYVLAILFSVASLGLMWLGDKVLDDAARIAASTFEIPMGGMLLGAVLFLLAGATFSVILMIGAKRERGYGYLVVAGVPLALVVILPLLWIEIGLAIPSALIRWMAAREIRGAAAFALGAVLTNLVWRAIGPIPTEEQS